jgi:hypothetical protein
VSWPTASPSGHTACEHLLIALLDSGSTGLAAVLDAFGTTPVQLRTTALALVGEPASTLSE